MKFNGLMKAIATAVALSAVSVPSMAGTLDDEGVKSALSKLTTNLTKSGVDASLVKTVHTDSTLAAYQSEVDGESFPVFFADSYFMTTATGDSLIRPDSMYVVSGGKLVPAAEVLTPILFENTKGDWISHELPEGVEHTGDMYVVTDPTCGYCKQVEQELEHYLNEGIVVHYIPFPRSGIDETRKQQPGYQRWVQAVCAGNPAKAYQEITLGDLTTYSQAKSGSTCAGDTSVIDKGYNFGRSIGVSGTPYMFLETNDGKRAKVPGYRPYNQILGEVGIVPGAKASANQTQSGAPVGR